MNIRKSLILQKLKSLLKICAANNMNLSLSVFTQSFSKVARLDARQSDNDSDNDDNDVYFTLATSDSRIGKYKTVGEQLRDKNRSIRRW